MNVVTLSGRIGQDPEIRRLENGAIMAKFSLATSNGYKDKSGQWVEKTLWHTCIAWRGLAESVERALQKGDAVVVRGSLEYNTWKDSNEVQRTDVQVFVNEFDRIARADGPVRESKPAPADASSSPWENQSNGSPEADDDLPF